MTDLDTSVKIMMTVMADNYKNGHEWDHLDALACRKASEVITALEAEIARKDEALRTLRDQFAFYAREHRAAGKDEKAETNERFEQIARAALESKS